jgi:YD repeat-containing protein
MAWAFSTKFGDRLRFHFIRKGFDVLSGEQIVYTYDALNRLASAQTTSGPTTWGQSYNYDGFGNLTDQNVIAGSAPSMHVTYNPATNRQYSDSADANGNITPSGGYGYQYDVLNRITSASGASYNYEYAVIPSCRSRSFHRTVNCVLTVCVSRGGKRTQ